MWSSGFEKLNKMALHMAGSRGIVDIDPRQVRVICDWSPMLPRDREQLVNEIVARDKSGHICQRMRWKPMATRAGQRYQRKLLHSSSTWNGSKKFKRPHSLSAVAAMVLIP